MNRDQIISKLSDLYLSSHKNTVDEENFKAVVNYIDDLHSELDRLHDTVSLVKLMDEYQHFFILLLEALPVSELAKLCGVSRTHMYRLLRTDSRLRIFLEYRRKYEPMLHIYNILKK